MTRSLRPHGGGQAGLTDGQTDGPVSGRVALQRWSLSSTAGVRALAQLRNGPETQEVPEGGGWTPAGVVQAEVR